MKNNHKCQVTIQMNNIDHAGKLVEVLNEFFILADMGGDCDMYFGKTKCGTVGHDVRKPKIFLSIIYED